jgi:hypothetical protein
MDATGLVSISFPKRDGCGGLAIDRAGAGTTRYPPRPPQQQAPKAQRSGAAHFFVIARGSTRLLYASARTVPNQ